MAKPLLSTLIRNAKKEHEPLTHLIDQYLLRRDSSPNRYWGVPAPVRDRERPPGRLSPSSICGCQRLAVFRFLGIQGTRLVDPEAEITFDDGKWRHLRLGWMCRDMQAVLGKDVFRVISIEERVSYDDLFIDGSLDIACAIYGVPWVIDFKGINQMGFDWIFRRGSPKEEHIKQVRSYMRLRKIKRGAIWYENRNNGQYAIFTIDWEPRAWREIKIWCQDVISQMKNERLPVRHPECRDGHYLYGRCIFTRLCYGGKTDAEIERRIYRNFPGVETLWKQNRDKS